MVPPPPSSKQAFGWLDCIGVFYKCKLFSYQCIMLIKKRFLIIPILGFHVSNVHLYWPNFHLQYLCQVVFLGMKTFLGSTKYSPSNFPIFFSHFSRADGHFVSCFLKTNFLFRLVICEKISLGCQNLIWVLPKYFYLALIIILLIVLCITPSKHPPQLRGHREPAPHQAHHERMNGKWSWNSFLLGSSSVTNHDG